MGSRRVSTSVPERILVLVDLDVAMAATPFGAKYCTFVNLRVLAPTLVSFIHAATDCRA
jgi:hypothetical protein